MFGFESAADILQPLDLTQQLNFCASATFAMARRRAFKLRDPGCPRKLNTTIPSS